MKHALIIQHVAFEGPGLIAQQLALRGITHELVSGWSDMTQWQHQHPDLLVVMGGPVGVYETTTYPWLEAEISFIRDWLQAGKPCLGVCLGAQLMAAALGAKVYYSGQKEIGYGPVTLSAAGLSSALAPLAAPDAQVLHWHGDTFDLPADSTLLASSALTPHQAFSWGRTALGLQFHVEVIPEQIEAWLVGHAAELAAAGIDVPHLRATAAASAAPAGRVGQQVIGNWLEEISGG